MFREMIFKVLSILGENRKVFNSEADFQFAFAWELQKLLPSATVRLEYCPVFKTDMHIDIFVEYQGEIFPIELKYKSKSLSYKTDYEYFRLKDHSAQDLGRYDYILDINRIECIKDSDNRFGLGYAIMLTNDSLYWDVSNRNNTDDLAFRTHEGKNINGILTWGKKPVSPEKKKRGKIELKGDYVFHWFLFSELRVKNGTFKYLVTEVQ